MASHDLVATAATIGGLPGYRWEESSGVSFGLVLTDESLLSGSRRSVADAIAAHDAGLSIADDSVFTDTMGRLPDQRMVSFYMGGGVLDGLSNLATASIGMPSGQQADDLFDAVGVSLALVDAGVEVDYVMVGVDRTHGVDDPGSRCACRPPRRHAGVFLGGGGRVLIPRRPRMRCWATWETSSISSPVRSVWISRPCSDHCPGISPSPWPRAATA